MKQLSIGLIFLSACSFFTPGQCTRVWWLWANPARVQLAQGGVRQRPAGLPCAHVLGVLLLFPRLITQFNRSINCILIIQRVSARI